MSEKPEVSDLAIKNAAEHAFAQRSDETAFKEMGFKTPQELEDHIRKVIAEPKTEYFYAENGRTVFSNEARNTRIIIGPTQGTCIIDNKQGRRFDGQYVKEAERLVGRGLDIQKMSPVMRIGDQHVSKSLGALAFATDINNGNYQQGMVDSVGIAAETKTGQNVIKKTVDYAEKAASHLGPTSSFMSLAKKFPIVPLYFWEETRQKNFAEEQKFLEAGRPDLADAARFVGDQELRSLPYGGLVADGMREVARQGAIFEGGKDYVQLGKSDTRNIIEGVGHMAIQVSHAIKEMITGKPVSEVLPATHSSMAQGTDDMGDRSEIKRIAVERTGLAANDPHNDIQTLLNENKWRPMGHLLILADGTVQGPEQGAIPFGSNLRIAAGKNGETSGVMYAGQGAMNDAQASTFAQVTDHLIQLRTQDGLHSPLEVIAGSTSTAEIMSLPTPRGPLQSTEPPQTAPQLQRRQSNSLGGS